MKFLINVIVFVVSFFSLSLFFTIAINEFHLMITTTGYLQGIYFSSFVLSILLVGFSLVWMIISFFGNIGK